MVFFNIVSAANMRSTSDRIFWEQASLVEIDINKSKIRHKALDRKASISLSKNRYIFFINNMFICCTRQHIYCKLTFHRDSICSLSSYKGDEGLCRASDMTTPTAMFRLAPNADTHHRCLKGLIILPNIRKKITNSKFSGISFAIFFHDLLSIHTEPGSRLLVLTALKLARTRNKPKQKTKIQKKHKTLSISLFE